MIGLTPKGLQGCCHDHTATPKAHKRHHWVERFKCAGFCLLLHVAYEIGSHYWWHQPHQDRPVVTQPAQK